MAASMTAEFARVKGNGLLQGGDYGAAIEVYSYGLQVASDNSVKVALLANRALACLRCGQYTEALADCENVLLVEPGHTKAAFRRGKALLWLGRYKEAENTFVELTRKEPKNAAIHTEFMLAKSAVAQALRGEFDFHAILKEASQLATQRLNQTAPVSEYTNEALELAQISETHSRFRARTNISSGDLLIMSKATVFLGWDHVSGDFREALGDAMLKLAKSNSRPVSQLIDVKQQGCDSSGLKAGVDLINKHENICRCSFASTTGVGIWDIISSFNHASVANSTRIGIADWLLVRARYNVCVGEWLTVSYVDATEDYAVELMKLNSLGVADAALERRARRWASVDDPHLEDVKSCLAADFDRLPAEVPSHLFVPTQGSPIGEMRQFLSLLKAESGQLWCWGQLVRWLRCVRSVGESKSQPARCLGAALAEAELLERHLDSNAIVLEAWADCIVRLEQLPNLFLEIEEADTIMEICMDGVHRNIEFMFGAAYSNNAEFLQLVLGWALMSRWHQSKRHGL